MVKDFMCRSLLATAAFILACSSTVSVFAAGTPNGQTLNQHSVMVDGSNKIVSWTANQDQAYDTAASLAWNYLLHQVPNDPSTGKPAYYSQSYLDPNTQGMAGWPHNPASMNSMLIESAMDYYQYSGNTEVLQLAQNIADHHLGISSTVSGTGMTLASDNWSNVPYSSGDVGTLTYHGSSQLAGGAGDGAGNLEPDKVGELGH